MVRFRSKIDFWLGAAIMLGALVSAGATIGLLFQSAVAPLAILPLVGVILPLWLLSSTWYGVTDTHLLVRSGPFRTAVPLSSIRSVHPTGSVLSAPALSLDRLEVRHTGGAVVISPADKAGFIAALKERHATIGTGTPSDDDVARQQRLLLYAMPIVPVVVLLVVGYAVVSGSNPPRVVVTAASVTVDGTWGTTVDVADITSLRLVDELPHVRRTMGYGGWRTIRGRVTSRDLRKDGHAYITRGSPPFIVAETAGGFLAINLEDPAATRRLFAELQAVVAH